MGRPANQDGPITWTVRDSGESADWLGLLASILIDAGEMEMKTAERSVMTAPAVKVNNGVIVGEWKQQQQAQ